MTTQIEAITTLRHYYLTVLTGLAYLSVVTGLTFLAAGNVQAQQATSPNSSMQVTPWNVTNANNAYTISCCYNQYYDIARNDQGNCPTNSFEVFSQSTGIGGGIQYNCVGSYVTCSYQTQAMCTWLENEQPYNGLQPASSLPPNNPVPPGAFGQ